jgi:two-component system OmpR family sensor kinase
VSLRARLAISSCAIGLILAGAFLFVGWRQERVLTHQLDAQLESVSRNTWRLVDPLKPAKPGAATRVPTGTYVGLLDAAGMKTILPSENRLVPRVDAPELTRHAESGTTSPFTVGTSSASHAMRIVGVSTTSGWVVTGISTDPIESATRQLTITGGIALAAVLGVLTLLMLWVNRLGLRPIRELTNAAEEIAGGRLERRVRASGPNTEAGRLATAFNVMAEARQGAEQRLRRFVADASHELRTPLTALRGYTALIANGGFSEPGEIDDAVRRIGQEATRMGTLVDDLLLLASLDEQRPLLLESVDLSCVVQDVAVDAQAIQPARSITVTAPETVTVLADRHVVVQVAAALVSNALKHTPASAPIELTASHDNGSGVMTVRDGGPGIPSGELDRIFERFYRLDAGRQRSNGGSGLGLSIVRSAVEAHGGTVTVLSRPGTGTTFAITLPASPDGSLCQEQRRGGADGGRPS